MATTSVNTLCYRLGWLSGRIIRCKQHSQAHDIKDLAGHILHMGEPIVPAKTPSAPVALQQNSDFSPRVPMGRAVPAVCSCRSTSLGQRLAAPLHR